jgi:hypothetical protein
MKLAFLDTTANRVVTERVTVPQARQSGPADFGPRFVGWLAAVFQIGGGKNRAAATDRPLRTREK